MPSSAISQPSVVELWREKLQKLQSFYCRIRPQTRYFFLKLFLFFVVINITCYWLAMVTAFPNYVFGSAFSHYAKIMFPVGILGAIFDSLSFYVTLYLIRCAIGAQSALRFVSHLSIDFVIAIIATWWVLFVFVISGWLINMIEGKTYEENQEGQMVVVATEEVKEELTQKEIGKQHLEQRKDIYTKRLVDAIENPGRNWRNIYFGVIMGMSAMLPTCLHIVMFLLSFFSKLKVQWMKKKHG